MVHEPDILPGFCWKMKRKSNWTFYKTFCASEYKQKNKRHQNISPRRREHCVSTRVCRLEFTKSKFSKKNPQHSCISKKWELWTSCISVFLDKVHYPHNGFQSVVYLKLFVWRPLPHCHIASILIFFFFFFCSHDGSFLFFPFLRKGLYYKLI